MAAKAPAGEPFPFDGTIDFAADLDAQVAVVLEKLPAVNAADTMRILWGQPDSPKPGPAYEAVVAAVKRARGDAPAPKAPKAEKAAKKTTKGGGQTPGVQNLIERQKENALLAAWAAQGSPDGEWMASGQVYQGRPPTPLSDKHDAEVKARKTTTRKAFKAAVAEKAAAKTADAAAKEEDKVVDITTQTPAVSKRTAQRRAAAERKAQREAAAKNAENN